MVLEFLEHRLFPNCDRKLLSLQKKGCYTLTKGSELEYPAVGQTCITAPKLKSQH